MGDSQNLPAFRKLRDNEDESTHYSLLYEGVPDEFRTYAETELKETRENVANGMRTLKQFLEKKKGKNFREINDNTLRAVLRSCKYDVKKSVKKLDTFLETRSIIIGKLVRMDTKTIAAILEDECNGLLPYRDKHGPAISFSQLPLHLDLYQAEDAFVVFYAFIFYLLKFPMTSLFGVVYIGNCKATSLAILYSYLLAYKVYLSKYYFSIPLRTRKVFLINDNFLIRWFVRIIRPVLPSKLGQRISFHGHDPKSLHKFIHPDILPEEFGGNMGPLDTKFYRKEFLDFVKKLKSEHGGKSAS